MLRVQHFSQRNGLTTRTIAQSNTSKNASFSLVVRTFAFKAGKLGWTLS